jgi:hypothetical protein
MRRYPNALDNYGDDLPVRNWLPISLRLSVSNWRLIRKIAADERRSLQQVMHSLVRDACIRRGLAWQDLPDKE